MCNIYLKEHAFKIQKFSLFYICYKYIYFMLKFNLKKKIKFTLHLYCKQDFNSKRKSVGKRGG